METQIKEEAGLSMLEPDLDAPQRVSLIEKYDRFLKNNSDPDSDGESFDDIKREYSMYRNSTPSKNQDRRSSFITRLPSQRSIDTCVEESLEKLQAVRKCGSDGNSIFCSEEELDVIQKLYSDILDYICEKLSATAEEEIKLDKANLLHDKMKSLEEVRDKFYEIEQQVRENIEQLELVERYKMESLG